MASVYRAIDHDRARLGLEDRAVAVKVVDNNAARPADAAMLLQEFQCAQRLSHPNVINVFDIDREGDRTFYSMELLSGARLSQLLRRLEGGPLPERYALRMIRDIGAAVAHAHSRGVVHADLKPSNVMITRDGELRVVDFGGQSMPPREPWISEGDDDDAVHHATPAYASCEQLERRRADPRDDIYALACIAYLLLSGRHPFDYLPSIEARSRGLRPRRPSGMPARRWRALRQGLAWAREDRPADIEAWLAQLGLDCAADRLPPLADLTTPIAQRGRWPRVVGITALVVAIGAVAAVILSQQNDLGATIQSWQAEAARGLDRLAGPPDRPAAPEHAAVDGSAPATPLPPNGNATIASAPPAPAAARAADALRSSAPAAATDASPRPSGPPAAPPGPHVAFSASDYLVRAGEPAARIAVQRATGTRGELKFIWWTVPGSAEPDVDYAATGARTEHLPAGQDRVTIYVPIISNPLRRTAQRFEVVLADDASHRGSGGAADARATVTIAPNR